MTFWEFAAFTLGLALIVYLACRVTGTWCGWLGHSWYRTSVWKREYRCRTCGDSRG